MSLVTDPDEKIWKIHSSSHPPKDKTIRVVVVISASLNAEQIFPISIV